MDPIRGGCRGGGRTFASPDGFRGGETLRFHNSFSIALKGKKTNYKTEKISILKKFGS